MIRDRMHRSFADLAKELGGLLRHEIEAEGLGIPLDEASVLIDIRGCGFSEVDVRGLIDTYALDGHAPMPMVDIDRREGFEKGITGKHVRQNVHLLALYMANKAKLASSGKGGTLISVSALPAQTYQHLSRAKIYTLEKLCLHTPGELIKAVNGVSQVGLEQIRTMLAEHNRKLLGDYGLP